MAFRVIDGAVYWASVRLSQASVEDLLDLFEREGDQPEARAAFNELYEAHVKTGGIPRVSSLARREAA